MLEALGDPRVGREPAAPRQSSGGLATARKTRPRPRTLSRRARIPRPARCIAGAAFLRASRRARAPGTPSTCRSGPRSEEHTSELQSRLHLVCRLLLEKKKKKIRKMKLSARQVQHEQ